MKLDQMTDQLFQAQYPKLKEMPIELIQNSVVKENIKLLEQ
jgi:hypothetical protein